MKTYHGYRKMLRVGGPGGVDVTIAHRCVVTVREGGRTRPLRPRHDIRNHSPDGFEWGYGGSGPAQLALALVADCCGAKMAQPVIYQRVKALVAKLPADGWTLTEEQVRAWASAAKEAAGAFYRED